jgi:hypothetical protein
VTFSLRRTALPLLFALIAVACHHRPVNEDVAPALPAEIRECETNTARICGTWTRVVGTSTYSASWANGSKAIITVVQLDDRAVVFTRRDTEGPTRDMVARYVAIPDGSVIRRGQVRWTTGGLTFFGIWDAHW